jgi:hypothetical protein
MVVTTLAAALIVVGAPSAKVDAKATFETMKAMVGEWRGKDVPGRTLRLSVELIAGGTTMVERYWDEAAGEKSMMMTMYHLDGDRLMLTHYCVARSQPRMVATESEDKKVKFTFLDATGLSSRDQGHMDSVNFNFVGKDALETRWGWYQDGKEQWAMEIKFNRIEKPAKTLALVKPATPGDSKASCCCGG